MDYDGADAVETFAGRPEEGHRDGAARYALFKLPSDLTLSRDCRRLFLSEGGQRVRQIDFRRGVSTVAGCGLVGQQDGAVATATFGFPSAVVLAADERALYVVDTSAHALRAIEFETQRVTTLVGGGKAQRDGSFEHARFDEPKGLARNSRGDVLFVSDRSRIYAVDLARRTVSFLAGGVECGFRDGALAESQFHAPDGMCMTDDHTLYVADTYNHCVRRVNLHARTVTRVAGDGQAGLLDGPTEAARFKYPQKIALDPARERLFVSELNDAVRVVDLRVDRVATLAGTGQAGYQDGAVSSARFSFPCGLAWDAFRSTLYLADSDNHCIRAIALRDRDATSAAAASASSSPDSAAPPTRVPTAVLLNALAQCRLSGIETSGIEQLVEEAVTLRDQNHLLVATLHDLQRRNDDMVAVLEAYLAHAAAPGPEPASLNGDSADERSRALQRDPAWMDSSGGAGAGESPRASGGVSVRRTRKRTRRV